MGEPPPRSAVESGLGFLELRREPSQTLEDDDREGRSLVLLVPVVVAEGSEEGLEVGLQAERRVALWMDSREV